MFKAFLLFLCVLAFTPMVAAQERTHRSPTPSPAGRQVNPATPVFSKERLDRLRPIAQAILESQRASAQGTAPDQHLLTAPPAMSVLGGFTDLTQGPALRKYGPFGPNVKYGLMGPLAEEQSARQSANAQLNPGVVVNLPEGFTHPLDGVSRNLNGVKFSLEGLDLNLEKVKSIGALNQLLPQIEAFNQPPMLRSIANMLAPQPLASADSDGPVRAQASGLKLPGFIRNLFKDLPTCAEKAQLLYTKCIDGKTGPKGGHSSQACENGRAAYLRECR
jgi:hypothetical protein